MSKIQKYILVDPNNDTGNDDGVLDKMDMTAEEAKSRNDERRRLHDDRRWIKQTKENSDHLYHSDD